MSQVVLGMSRILSALLVLISTMLHAENVLHVKAGDTFELAAQPVQSFDRLILEDRAVLLVPPGLKQLQLEAAWVELGEDVKILARGEDGKPGAPGQDREGQAEECQGGRRGGDGGHGTQGAEGVSLVMFVLLVVVVVRMMEGGDGGWR